MLDAKPPFQNPRVRDESDCNFRDALFAPDAPAHIGARMAYKIRRMKERLSEPVCDMRPQIYEMTRKRSPAFLCARVFEARERRANIK